MALLYLMFIVVIKRDIRWLKLIITPGLLAFLIFGIISAVLCTGRMLSEGDEFSHIMGGNRNELE